MGYSNLREYKEGKQDWVEAGPPTEGEGHTGAESHNEKFA